MGSCKRWAVEPPQPLAQVSARRGLHTPRRGWCRLLPALRAGVSTRLSLLPWSLTLRLVTGAASSSHLSEGLESRPPCLAGHVRQLPAALRPPPAASLGAHRGVSPGPEHGGQSMDRGSGKDTTEGHRVPGPWGSESCRGARLGVGWMD